MVSLFLELFFLIAIGVTFIATFSVIFFLRVFDKLFDEEVYKTAYLSFKVVLLAILFHLTYHLTGDVFSLEQYESISEFLSLIFFVAGLVIIANTTMRTHISHEAHRRLQAEVDRMTNELKSYVADLERSNKLKDLFTDVMTHDILSPVGVIINYSDLMMTEEEMFEKESLKIIRKNALRALEMIKDAAVLARMPSAINVTPESGDLGALLKSEIELITPKADEKGIRLKHEIKGEYMGITTPFTMDIFRNLLSNAVKYSPEDSFIEASIETVGGFQRISVKDRGEGVPDKYKEMIFERFGRAEKQGVKGTGLGLAIVKKAVESSRGRVWVEDNPLGGSIFIVELPRSL